MFKILRKTYSAKASSICDFFLHLLFGIFTFAVLSDGVTGNTSGFGPEESRFEP